jgi:hypothetical protein
MHTFSELNIRAKVNDFTGDKIPVKKLLNQTIKVIRFKVEPSTAKPGTECLTLQIEKSAEPRVVFTGSTYLIDQIKQVPEDKFPFATAIKEVNDHYEFS